MIKRFDVTLEIDEKDIMRDNIYASDVLEMFDNISWREQYEKCLADDNEFGPYFSVSYKDELNLEYSFDVELYAPYEEEEDKKMSFSLTYSYQETRMKKIFFGLFGEKEKINNEIIFMDDQNMEFASKCLQAFLRHDKNFLLNNMYENFGTDVKE